LEKLAEIARELIKMQPMLHALVLPKSGSGLALR
jgi:hypothetical protein